MDILAAIRTPLTDERFSANLILFYGLVSLTVIVSLVLRRLLARGSSRLAQWSGRYGFDTVGEEAVVRARSLLSWLTCVTVAGVIVAGLGYHVAGRDIRHDAETWIARMTLADLFGVCVRFGAVAVLGTAAWGAVWALRRGLPVLETSILGWAGRADNEEALRRCFSLSEKYAVAAARLAAVWGAGIALGLGTLAGNTVGFFLRILSIVVVARLLILLFRVVVHAATDLGDRHLGQGHFRHYWERNTRLLPFGERCFEAAVYISAAALCVRELDFIAFVADFGPRLVQCIGILFSARVVIELVQVLLNETFGLYDDERPLDSKGRTLVPLLQSVCQYVLYFGSAVIMMGVLGVDTRPILAGAGILGLAVGLGAQNLVTDVVSGFFILFESQYLVGDFVQIGDAVGTVEAVGIRLTQIRDLSGKLYLIPNGQIKGVVNYSKGYINAVVDVRVPSGRDLEGVFRAMTDAGRRLRQAHKEVLADTVIQGLVDLGASEMTVRAVTKVKPGTHMQMQNEYRRMLKQVFDQQSTGKPAAAA